MNEDNKIATLNYIKGLSSDIPTIQNAINQIIDEIKNKTNYTENNYGRAVPYYAIKDNTLLQVTSAYDNNQLVKSSHVFFVGPPDNPEDGPSFEITYDYNIPVTIDNTHGSSAIEQNAIIIKFGDSTNAIAINVPHIAIELEKVKTEKSIQRSGTSPNFTTDIYIDFSSSSFKNNYNITCSCNDISKTSEISSSSGGQTEIKLEDVELLSNINGDKNEITITIEAAS